MVLLCFQLIDSTAEDCLNQGTSTSTASVKATEDFMPTILNDTLRSREHKISSIIK